MNEYFDIIMCHLKKINAEYNYDEEDEILNVAVGKTSSDEIIYESIFYSGHIFCAYLSMELDQDFDLDNEHLKHKLSEFLHRANFNMLRGNFEFEFDQKIIRFKHCFDKSTILDRDYTMYNISLPVVMFKQYTNRLKEILTTNISPKEMIEKIENEELRKRKIKTP